MLRRELRSDIGGAWAFRSVYFGSSSETADLRCDDHGFRVIHRRRCEAKA